MTLIGLTPTGLRPLPLLALERRLAAAPGRPDLWLVIDDGDPPSSTERLVPTRHVLRLPSWQPGQITLRENLLKGLQLVLQMEQEDVAVMILEDDDWYAPAYFDEVRESLKVDNAEVIGAPLARYINVRSMRALENRNVYHASLSATTVRGAGLMKLYELCQNHPSHFLDIPLWEWALKEKVGFLNNALAPLTVGVKGLPGRAGIGIGHRRDMGYHAPHAVAWLGEDADEYLRMVDRKVR